MRTWYSHRGPREQVLLNPMGRLGSNWGHAIPLGLVPSACPRQKRQAALPDLRRYNVRHRFSHPQFTSIISIRSLAVTPTIPWIRIALAIVASLMSSRPMSAGDHEERSAASLFTAMDVFSLEYAGRPQISPDGGVIAYERHSMDLLKDVDRSSLWMVRFDGSEHRPLTDGTANASHPVWSRDGRRLAYVSTEDGTTQLYLRWLDTGQTARLTQLTRPPTFMRFSPDGQWIAFSMLVPKKSEQFVKLPQPPKGADWADPPTMINKLDVPF